MVKLDRLPDAAVVTIDRPDVKNALDEKVVAALHEQFDALERDGAPIVILTGAGDAFVSGADIAELKERTRMDALRRINSGLFRRIEQYPMPVVAAINGHALGGGLELALSCDIRVAVRNAKLGQPEVGLGIIPGAGACYRLPRIIGLGRAKELILSARFVDAEEALRIGLVSAIGDDAFALAKEQAARLARLSPLALRFAKATIDATAYASIEAGMAIESASQAVLFEDDDKKARMDAFLKTKRSKRG